MKRVPLILLILIVAAAIFLRFWMLDSMPPGWRDDELINSLVISQHAIDGDFRFFYADASGHEGLYHILNALPLYLFGPSAAGIRWISAVMGCGVVLATYFLARRLLGRETIALTAAAGLAVRFWSLMYSRIGLRHISLIFLVVPAFALLWWGINQKIKAGDKRPPSFWAGYRLFVLAGLLLGLAFYTYFASRGIPLILLAWLGYLLVFNRAPLARVWGGVWLTLILAGVMAIPLFLTLQSQPEAEARVAELAVPVIAAREGNYGPLLEFTRRTLNMFHSDGDDEFLYNIPGRPVFGPLGALFFWSGVLLAGWAALKPSSIRRGQNPDHFSHYLPDGEAAAFLLLWWLAGISPAFLSVPPGSLSHTILAQPAVYILAALPVGVLAGWITRHRASSWSRPAVAAVLGLILVGAIAWRDLPDYFVNWPARGNTRFLYRADIHDVARLLQTQPGEINIGLTTLLAGPWDRVAFEANLGQDRARVDGRWFNPGRALLLEPELSWIGYPTGNEPFAAELFVPTGRTKGGYREAKVDPAAVPAFGPPTCFTNGLCLAVLPREMGESYVVDLLVTVDQPLDLPPIPLISNPPPPGVYAGPRLLIFTQLLDGEGGFLIGDDALGVDPLTLEVGDKFWQRHRLTPAAGQKPATITVGLYDPKTGERLFTLDGAAEIQISLDELVD